jgi:hypothetical protein
VPDPFGTHESFGAHNNAMLRAFLDAFGFEYEFQSSTDWYKSGRFDAGCCDVLRRYEARSWRSCCPTWARSARDLFALPAGVPEDRPRAAGADPRDRRRRRHHRLSATRTAGRSRRR